MQRITVQNFRVHKNTYDNEKKIKSSQLYNQ